MIRSTGTYDSAKASQYLQLLCKHFAHKTDVTFDAHQGRVALRSGAAEMTATAERLTVTVSAPDRESLPGARHAIDKHLAIFAHREGFEAMDWQEPVAG